MRATRRNVLVILGVLTIAGGALFGTGAFTQVEAQRSVDVETQGDADAQLGLNITDDDLAGSGDTIEFSEDQLNQNATTIYNESFVVSNNDNDGTAISSVDIRAGGTSLIGDSDQVMYFDEASESDTRPLNEGDSITYNVVFDTTNEGDIPQEITIVADDDS